MISIDKRLHNFGQCTKANTQPSKALLSELSVNVVIHSDNHW